MKKILSLTLALAILVSVFAIIPMSSNAEALPMYVYTANGKTLRVRSAPNTGNNVIGTLNYGDKVMVEFINSAGWAVILYNGHEAYVMGRFLVEKKPGPKPEPTPEQKEAEELKAEQAKLNNELKSEREVAEPFYVVVRPTRTSGWINFRVGPGKITTRIASFGNDKELLVVGETNKWYRARDPETNKTGYIFKDYTMKVSKTVASVDNTQKLGSLNVNGEFDLTCKLPEGYNLQVLSSRGEAVRASVLPVDMTKPQMYLSIAYDDTYGDVERMNDLTDEELKVLEGTFNEMNQVEISYRTTGYGTKLLVARETGSDTDFVDILAIYKGYFIEFNMTPNPNTANQTLTEEQIRMCVDFLTDVNFVPAK